MEQLLDVSSTLQRVVDRAVLTTDTVRNNGMRVTVDDTLHIGMLFVYLTVDESLYVATRR